MAANLELVITAKDQASGALGAIDKKAQGLGSTLSTFGKVAAVGAAAGLAVAGAAAVKFIGVASDLNEVANKSLVVFGDSNKAVTDFASQSAKSFGIAKVDALGYASTLGVILKGSGLAQDASADMSVGLTKLAADMASFNNIPIDVALEKIRAGLVGESEPLRTVGVLLSEAAVQEEAYASGLAERGAKLTDAQKVQARYNLILKSTTDQQGDFQRTSGSLANRLRILGAQWKDLQAIMGNLLLPVVTAVAGVLVKILPPAIEAVQRGVQAFIGGLRDGESDLEGWRGALQQAGFILRDDVLPVLRDIGNFLQGTFIPAIRSVGESFANFAGQKALIAAALTVVALGFGAIAVSAGAAAVSVIAATLPIIAIAAAAGALVAGLVILDEKTGIVTATFNYLTEVAKLLWEWVGPNLFAAVDTLRQGWNDLLPILKEVGGYLEEHLGPILEDVLGWLRDHPEAVAIAAAAIVLLTNPWLGVVAAMAAVLAMWDKLKIKAFVAINQMVDAINVFVRAWNSIADKEFLGVNLGPHLPEQQGINIGQAVGSAGQGMGQNIGQSPINQRALGGVTINFNSVVPADPATIQRSKLAIESILRS